MFVNAVFHMLIKILFLPNTVFSMLRRVRTTRDSFLRLVFNLNLRHFMEIEK